MAVVRFLEPRGRPGLPLAKGRPRVNFAFFRVSIVTGRVERTNERCLLARGAVRHRSAWAERTAKLFARSKANTIGCSCFVLLSTSCKKEL
jgi:hypothetical protein